MIDNRLFRTPREVSDFFIRLSNPMFSKLDQNKKDRGIMIDTKLRREILTGENEGKVTINGRVEKYEFKNLTGGVYLCTVTDPNRLIPKSLL